MQVRLLLYRFFWIRAVVSLPRNLFIDTPTLTSLLFAQKKTEPEVTHWDTAYTASETKVSSSVSATRKAMKKATTAGGTAKDVGNAFHKEVSRLWPSTTTVSIRGSGPLSFTLPKGTTDPWQAIAYYERILGSAAFRDLCRGAAFRMAAQSQPYEYPVYAVDEVGFKLSKRGKKARSNQLARFIDLESGEETPNLHLHPGGVSVDIDTASPQRIIDHMRSDVTWT